MHLPLVPNSQIRPPSSASRYNLAISELTGTEASYVHALQLFCLLRHLVRENALLDNQTLDEVFGNIDALLKFHKSFLKTAEDVSLLPEDQQCWGPVFSAFLDVADLYVDYIGNHRVHLKAAIREHDKLSVASWPPQVRQLVAGTEMIHHTFLRPYSRFAKYSVFLKEIHRGTQCETKRADLESAISLHHSILSKAGEALDTMARGQAVSDLHNRIEDWKHHNPATFGRLLLFDAFLCRPKKELEPALQV
ncbi:Guanine nucleotide exchange factor for Cdc42p [Conoideocrella luteorostrata]|uniref:Guanine nucleotide exchange factor for Cdc42p n=1 Tax=Conoideocrella luteorostrata TaxID=1105319 RepID=A0AAJ0FX86_9HYPO|nr:Guanine nucleotide exchange factor for Cdc42p [Conoideocrella luteorostrata]